MNKLHGVLNNTVTEDAYRQIRQLVINGKIRPGQKVSQLRLSRELGCSTIPVAEAMRLLESEGVLNKQPRKMAVVRELNNEELEGLYLIREGLESIAARLCAQRITEDQVVELRRLGQRFEQVVAEQGVTDASMLDAELHIFVVHCAASPLLKEELCRLFLIEQTAGRTDVKTIDPGAYRISHRTIIEAIANRDVASAEYYMKLHIQNGYREVSQRFNADQED